ncbi:biogenesis of lysosome-related organelles complex 1 subunit 6-like [Ptychodera flava]|uniref:biogenesis of lysosome-related organelles complex 1 subunit 6-like n=1 Tax=Ptychodera flava TaxID=63121 RepID=UPI003969E822
MATAGIEPAAPSQEESTSSLSREREEVKDAESKKDEKDADRESNTSELSEATIEIGHDAVATISLRELESNITFNPEATNKLTEGLLQSFVPETESTKQLLNELTRHQGILLETLQQENAKFTECHAMKELVDLFTEAKQYQQKLVSVRKEMGHLHDKTVKLKKRALKLQNEKMKENLKKEQQRDREHEQERYLIARPTKELQEKTLEHNTQQSQPPSSSSS